MTRRVVILTKSYKHGGYCVAGIDADHQWRWIRLVSGDAESRGALTDVQTRYRSGTACQVLDMVHVPVIAPKPIPYQPENVLIDETGRWEKAGTATLRQVLQRHPPDQPFDLLGNQKAAVPASKINLVGRSLILVKVHGLTVRPVITPSGKRRTRADFRYAQFEGTRFQKNPVFYQNIAVTDPVFYQVRNKQEYDSAYLVMSLPAVPVNKQFYKFAAKIFLPGNG